MGNLKTESTASDESEASECKNLLAVTAPAIPKSHADFASEVADIASKYGMDKFTMTYRPNFDQRFSDDFDSRISGEMKIIFSSVDGRGRSCRNLQIRCEADFSIHVESNRSSYS